MIKRKKKYIYTDDLGKKHEVRVSPNELVYCPYLIVDTGIRALRIQNFCKLMFWEKYKDMVLCSKSIICKYDESLLYNCLSKGELDNLAIPEEKLKELVNTYNKLNHNY